MAVCAKIREQEFTSSYSEVQFTVVCDVLKFTERQQRSNTILEDLDKVGIMAYSLNKELLDYHTPSKVNTGMNFST